MIDPKTIQSFLAVCELRSFSLAARLRGISQPTVTQHVQRLEALVGAPLFTRGGKEVVLTDAGEALRPTAAAFEAAHQEVIRHLGTSQASGRIRFGAAEDFAATQLPRVLRAFTRLNPDVSFSLTVQEYEPLIESLKTGEIDLVLVKQFGESLMKPFRGVVAAEDRLVWVADPGFDFTPEQPIPLVSYRAPSFTRTRVTRALQAEGIPWTVACECRGSSGIVAALRGGLGVGVLPLSLVPRELRVLDERQGLPNAGGIRFVLLRRADLTDQEEQAVDTLAEVVRRAVRGGIA